MIELCTPSRLHFGLLAYSRSGARQFGGVGLMIRKPEVVVRVESSDTIRATGPMAERAASFAERFIERCDDPALRGAHIQVVRAPRPHTGLGTGTQLGMAVARALALVIGRDDWDAAELAQRVGRGERSAIGAYGFFTGGLIVEGGKLDTTRLSPLLAHQPFPAGWRIVLVSPRRLEGLSGTRERQAFAHMPDISDDATAAMCRLVLLGLLPALRENDLPAFGEALFALQQTVGQCFAPAQGGIYADPMLDDIVQFIRAQNIPGVGQSSWGPTLYAVVEDHERAERLVHSLRGQFDFNDEEVIVTEVDNDGAQARTVQTPLNVAKKSQWNRQDAKTPGRREEKTKK